MRVFFYLVLCLALALPACAQRRHAPQAEQGVKGRVLFLAGNHMPGPAPGNGGTTEGVKRKICLYAPAVRLSELPTGSLQGSFVKLEGRKPAYTVTSGKDGKFMMPAAPGTYTMVVLEKGKRLFCSGLDGDGQAMPDYSGGGALDGDGGAGEL